MKRAVQTAEQMVSDMREDRQLKPYSKLYFNMNDEHNIECIKRDIGFRMELLAAAMQRGRVDLNDVDTVRTVACEYVDACMQTGQYPTLMGLSTAFGLSRRRVEYYCSSHENETTAFLATMKTLFSDVLANAALNRRADSITSIFVLKNSGVGVGLTNNDSPVTGDERGIEYMNNDEIIAKYSDIPEE